MGWRRLGGDARGNVAVLAAVAVPALAVLAAGGVELGALWSDRGKMQEAADAAALAAAHELVLADESGAAARARAMALGLVSGLDSRSTVSAEAEVVENGSAIRVSLSANRPSFFGSLLPPGGFDLQVEAVASVMGRTPLCVLAHGESLGNKVINAKDSARIRAPGCLIHSNEDVLVEGSARIDAGLVQASKEAKGSISPEPGEGAETIEDPFKPRELKGKGNCVGLVKGVLKLLGNGLTLLTHELPAGRHCTKISIEKNQQLTLGPGDHYFEKADLEMKEGSVLVGENVALSFDKDSKFDFKPTSVVDLYGREDGPLAGFLIVTTRDNTHDFHLLSDGIDNLLGVIYIPSAKLIVDGKSAVAEESAWTVIVADRVELKGSPTLVINKNYAASDVPVPDGVGNKVSETRLVQ